MERQRSACISYIYMYTLWSLRVYKPNYTNTLIVHTCCMEKYNEIETYLRLNMPACVDKQVYSCCVRNTLGRAALDG